MTSRDSRVSHTPIIHIHTTFNLMDKGSMWHTKRNSIKPFRIKGLLFWDPTSLSQLMSLLEGSIYQYLGSSEAAQALRLLFHFSYEGPLPHVCSRVRCCPCLSAPYTFSPFPRHLEPGLPWFQMFSLQPGPWGLSASPGE